MEHCQKYKVASVMSESSDAYASIACAVVWISECKLENTKTFIKVNGTCLNSSCLYLFSIWPFFSEVFLYHLFKYFKLLRLPNSSFKRQKFGNENGTFRDVFVYLCA